jgi:YesN/AraC family two-component response regulator
MVFALGGQLGLDEIRRKSFDVVVSDMTMPGVDGASLLNAVKDECPATVRILLSGYSDDATLALVLPLLHELLSKPCTVATLRSAIERFPRGTQRSIDTVDV